MKCQLCNQNVKGTRGLASHIRFSHDDIEYQDYIKTYVDTIPGYDPCDVCGKVTRSKGNTTFVTCSRECSATWKRENWTGENAPRHGKSHSQETRDKISESHRLLYENGYENPMNGKTHDVETVKKIFSSWKDSSAEIAFKDILERSKIDEYTHQFFLSRNGTIRSYDFKINDTMLIEVDGDYWHGGPGCEKHFKDVEDVKFNDRFKDCFAGKHGYKVIRFWESDIKQNPEWVLS